MFSENRSQHEPLYYTVERAIIDCAGVEKQCFLILEDGIPAVEANKHLVIQRCRRSRPVSTSAYNLCLFFNYMHSLNKSPAEASIEEIYNYLYEAYVEQGKTHRSIMAYIGDISNYFESLALKNYPLDKSLYRPFTEPGVRVKRNKKGNSLTVIQLLRKEFLPRTVKSESIYTKWYTYEEIEIIAAELPLVHRCIFLDTVLTGHRVDSALSITMDTVDFRKRQIYPTRTKTGKIHVSLMPQILYEAIETYLLEVRSSIVCKTGSTSPYLFLGRDGQAITYPAYNAALKRAGERVRQRYPALNITHLHSHAGRSTFAAALRTYQLDQKRKGLPTLTDADFCNLMDWKSLQCLENYDIATRAQEVSPLLERFFENYANIVDSYTLAAADKGGL